MRLSRDKRTGDYYTPDRKYQIYKGTVGWNVHEYDGRFGYVYIFSADTLREVRESLADEYDEVKA